MPHGVFAATLALLGSPLLFYSSVLWEHTIVAGLAAGAFLGLEGRRPRGALLAGGLLGGAALLRIELGLLAGAAAIALFASGRRRDAFRTGLGGAAGVTAHFVFQRLATGSWTGAHLGVNRPEAFRHFGTAAQDLLFSPGAPGAPAAAVGVALLALAIGASLRARLPRTGAGLTQFGAAVLAAISGAAWIRFPGEADRALSLIGSNSATVFLPWVLVVPFLPRADAGATGAAPHPRDRRRDPLPIAILLFLLAFLALAPARAITGVHPGPRMLLPLLPLVAALAAERLAVPGRRARRTAAIALLVPLIPTLLWSTRSLELLHGKRAASGRIAAALAADPRRLVVTDLFWLPTDLSALWFEKEFHLAADPDAFADLIERAAVAGEREMLVVVEAGTLPGPPFASVVSPGFPAFSVDLYVRRLGPPAGADHAPAPSRTAPEERP